jgi:hypothetical protein
MKKRLTLLCLSLFPSLVFSVGFDASDAKEGVAKEVQVFDGVNIFAFMDFEETERTEAALQLSGSQGIINLSYLPNTDGWEIEKMKDHFVEGLGEYYRELGIPYLKEVSVFSFPALQEGVADRKAYFIRSLGKDWRAFLSYLIVDAGDRTLLVHALGGSNTPKEGSGKVLLTESSMLGLRFEGFGKIEYVSGRFFAEKSGRNVIIDQDDADNPGNPPENSENQPDG